MKKTKERAIVRYKHYKKNRYSTANSFYILYIVNNSPFNSKKIIIERELQGSPHNILFIYFKHALVEELYNREFYKNPCYENKLLHMFFGEIL